MGLNLRVLENQTSKSKSEEYIYADSGTGGHNLPIMYFSFANMQKAQ